MGISQPLHNTYVIAEAGVNHNGSLQSALELTDVARQAGANAIKFQTFAAADLVTASAQQAAYQQRNTGKQQSQYELLQSLELTNTEFSQLQAHCRTVGIDFLSTPFDLSSARFLINDLGLKTIKISSGDLSHAPLLLDIAQQDCQVILSSGMATLSEIEQALWVLAYGYLGHQQQPTIELLKQAYCSEEGQQALAEKVSLLHCTTDYPTPYESVNLNAMDCLRHAFQLPIGLSDHTEGIAIPIAAVARGANIIEKHFTLDKTLPGPDHRASLEPAELMAMVSALRQVEVAMGDGRKIPSSSAQANRSCATRSIVADAMIVKGEAFSIDNLAIKRPGNGIAPIEYWRLLGEPAQQDYQPGDLIQWQ